MIELYKNHKNTIFIFLAWLIIGKLGGTIVGIGASLIALIYFWNRNEFLLVFFGLFILSVFAAGSTFPFAKVARNVYMLATCVLMLVNNLHKVIAVDVFYRKLGLFFVFSLPILLLSPTIIVSLQKNISFILLYICIPPLFLSVVQHNKKDFVQLLFLLLFAVFAGGLFLYVINPSAVLRVSRYKGLFGNPNEMGLFCLMSMIFVMTIKKMMSAGEEIVENRLYIVMYVLIFINLFLCGFRGCLLGFIVFFLIWFLRLKWISSLFLFTFVGLSYGLILENIAPIVQTLGFGEYMRLDSLDMAGGRIYGWTFAWEEIQKNMLFGKGWVYDEYIFKIHASELEKLNHQGGVHNSFLGIWLNTGLIGLGLFLIGIVRLFMKASSVNRIAIPAFFSFCTTAFFEPWMQSSLTITSVMMVMFLTIVIFAPEIFYEDYIDESGYLNGKNEILNEPVI